METIADMVEKKGYERGYDTAYQEKPKWEKHAKLEATQETLIDAATEQYGPLPGMLHEKIKSIKSLENLRALNRKVIRTQSLDEFTELVNRAVQ